jgi:hypothetical protein
LLAKLNVNGRSSEPRSPSASPVSAPTSLDDTPVLAKPDHTRPKPAAASITDETAPHANGARSPTPLVKPSANECRKGSNEPPTCPMSPQSASQPPNNTPTPAKTAANSIASGAAPHASNARSPALLAKHSANGHSRASSEPLSPVASPQPAPCSSGGPVTPPLPDRAPLKRTVTPPGGDVACSARTPATGVPTAPHAPNPASSKGHTVQVTPTLPTVHGPRDLSALCSGMSNPWGSLSRRHQHSRPPLNFSSHRSGTRNPWGSLHHRNRRSYPLHAHQVYSHPAPHRHSYPSPSHSEMRLCKPQSQSHPIPVHIFQVIQHPHGISPTKPKITKTIPTTTAKIQKKISTTRCACGNIIPAYRPDRESWRSMDTRFRRFRRRSRRFWIANEDVRYLRGGHL